MTPIVEIAQTVDARGLSCPLPLVKTAQAVKTMASGQALEVLATDPGSVKDFAAWSKTTANELVESTSDGAVYRFVIRVR
ncbi:MAG: sulfurtransferase TusA family protein [Candidatus Limnocylindrales bacterium]